MLKSRIFFSLNSEMSNRYNFFVLVIFSFQKIGTISENSIIEKFETNLQVSSIQAQPMQFQPP